MTDTTNTGDYNTGYSNTGYRNTGNYNTGDYNTGCRNTGYRNTGYYNTGNCNTGDYNTGYRNTGFFCTETPKPRFFDADTDITWGEAYERIPNIDLIIGVKFVPTSDMTGEEKQQHPQYETVGGYLRKHERPLREAFPIAWAKLTQAERQRWLDLPNFDADKFLEITGVDVRNESTGRTVKIRLTGGEIVEGTIV